MNIGGASKNYSTTINSRVQAHPFHLVEASPWPLIGSFSCLILTSGLAMKFHGYQAGDVLLPLGLITVIGTMTFWWRDVVREGTYQGNHTIKVVKGLTLGMILFIVSEVLFFFSFFWAFFHSSLSPTIEYGNSWPPVGIECLDYLEVPLLNTVLLLSSGVTVTWSHHSLIAGDKRNAIIGLFLTIVLAIAFTGLQGYEYYNASFTIADGAYGSTFYMATGFHGFHIIIGTTFLLIGMFRIMANHFTKHHLLGLEAGIWYWHFVDVVWLFLFICVYWWGGEAHRALSTSIHNDGAPN